MYVDYVYLDTEERRRFAQISHEYLIEQLQFTGDESVGSSSNKIKLNLNHPCKELIWVTRAGAVHNDNIASITAADNCILRLNGHDRFSQQPGPYFNTVQPYQHHTRCPGIGVYVYSFALNPEEHQPSGTCNFSRIDNAQLTSGSGGTPTATVYAVNYNVLRIMSGMGGLAYSN